jgi:hypothetical protein
VPAVQPGSAAGGESAGVAWRRAGVPGLVKGGVAVGNNASELGRTIKHLTEMGRLEKVDAGRVQAVRSMARALDENPQNAALWRQYREALKDLTRGESDGGLDDALAGLFGEVRDSPPA